MIAHLKWFTPPVHGSAPATKNHTATLVGNELFVFGGYDGVRNHSALHVLDLISWTWRNNVPCRGTPPSGRNGHSATLIPPLKKHMRGGRAYCEGAHNGHHLILVIGGWLGTGPYAARDAHLLDADAKEWLSTSEPSVAPGLHSVQLLVPGTRNTSTADGLNSATHDANSGSDDDDDDDSSIRRGSGRQVILGAGPGPCNMHTADWVDHRRQVLVFRGGDGRQYLNDLHALSVGTEDDDDNALGDGAAWQWEPLPTTGHPPRPRANHSSCVADRSLFVFGGWDGVQRLNDVHVLNTETLCWTEVAVASVLSQKSLRSPPLLTPPETGAAAAAAMADYAASVADAPAARAADPAATNESSKSPQPRAGMTLTSLHGLLFLFGGSGPGSGCFGDLQVLDPDAPQWVDTSPASAAAATSEQSNAQNLTSNFSATRGGSRGAALPSPATAPSNGLQSPASARHCAHEVDATNNDAANPNDGAPPPPSMARHRNGQGISSASGDHFGALDDDSGHGSMGALGMRNWRLKSERQTCGLSKVVVHGSRRQRRGERSNVLPIGLNSIKKHSDSAGPGRRAGHSATVCSDARRLIVFGGSLGNEYLNDIHVLDTDPSPSSACFASGQNSAAISSSPEPMHARNVAPARSLAQRLKPFVNASDFSDVVFVVEGQNLYAHRLVLAATSERFAASFRQGRPSSSSYSIPGGGGSMQGGFAESSSSMQEVMVPHHSYACFAMMLDYLYTGEIPPVLRSRHSIESNHEDGGMSDDDFDEDEVDSVPFFMATSEDTTVTGSRRGEDSRDVNCAPSRLVCGSERYEQAVELLAMGDEYMLEHLKLLAERALVRNCLQPLLRHPAPQLNGDSSAAAATHEEDRTKKGRNNRAHVSSHDEKRSMEEGERSRIGEDGISADPVLAVATELLELSERVNAWQLRASAAHALRNAGNARRARFRHSQRFDGSSTSS